MVPGGKIGRAGIGSVSVGAKLGAGLRREDFEGKEDEIRGGEAIREEASWLASLWGGATAIAARGGSNKIATKVTTWIVTWNRVFEPIEFSLLICTDDASYIF
jgi:hypothetical protein